MYPIPIRYEKPFTEWLAQNDMLPESKYKIQIYEAEPIPAQKPFWLKKRRWSKFSVNRLSPQSSVCIIPDGRIWGKDGIIITPDNLVIEEFNRSVTSNKQHPVFKEGNFPEPERTGNAAVITSIYANNYYHWLFDIIARIHLVRQSGINIDKYVINTAGKGFQKKWIEMIGLPEEQICVADPSLHLHAEQVIYPSNDQPVGHGSPWAIRHLHSWGQTIASLPEGLEESGYHDRIYVPRSGAGYRRVTNEDEVISFLEPYGFTPIHPEKHPVEEQIRLFANADLIVAPSGAALANLLFCKPGTKLAIFQPAGLEDISYYTICSVLQIAYCLIEGKPEGQTPILNQADMHISIKDLETVTGTFLSLKD